MNNNLLGNKRINENFENLLLKNKFKFNKTEDSSGFKKLSIYNKEFMFNFGFGYKKNIRKIIYLFELNKSNQNSSFNNIINDFFNSASSTNIIIESAVYYQSENYIEPYDFSLVVKIYYGDKHKYYNIKNFALSSIEIIEDYLTFISEYQYEINMEIDVSFSSNQERIRLNNLNYVSNCNFPGIIRGPNNNTCYMISLLQSLNILSYLKKEIFRLDLNNIHDFMFSLARLFHHLEFNNHNYDIAYILPNFKKEILMRDFHDVTIEHDVHEFYSKLLDYLEDYNPTLKISIEYLFKYKYKYKIVTNLSTSEREQEDNTLRLCIEGHNNINESIRNLLEKEKIGQYRKKMMFISLPRVLVVQLKRFNNDNTKNNNYFEFYEELDMNEYLFGDNIYQLHSVIVHQGSTDGGHYYCYNRPTNENKWYKFDDENVEFCSDLNQVFENNFGSESSEIDPSAYLLIYIKKNEVNNILSVININYIPINEISALNREFNLDCDKSINLKKIRFFRNQIRNIYYEFNQKYEIDGNIKDVIISSLSSESLKGKSFLSDIPYIIFKKSRIIDLFELIKYLGNFLDYIDILNTNESIDFTIDTKCSKWKSLIDIIVYDDKSNPVAIFGMIIINNDPNKYEIIKSLNEYIVNKNNYILIVQKIQTKEIIEILASDKKISNYIHNKEIEYRLQHIKNKYLDPNRMKIYLHIKLNNNLYESIFFSLPKAQTLKFMKEKIINKVKKLKYFENIQQDFSTCTFYRQIKIINVFQNILKITRTDDYKTIEEFFGITDNIIINLEI